VFGGDESGGARAELDGGVGRSSGDRLFRGGGHRHPAGHLHPGEIALCDLVVEAVYPDSSPAWVNAVKLTLGLICCYLAVSFVLQTKDDIRFVIPYVEFSKQSKGAKPLVLDTSVIIDGRIADIAETRIIDSELIIPRFVLQELQNIADSGDKLKRTRGRRHAQQAARQREDRHPHPGRRDGQS
jgi:uncharacterized protein YacL